VEHISGKWNFLIVAACNYSPPLGLHDLDAGGGLACSNESRSYARGSVVNGRVSHARLVCDEDPD
jgi:hypothetical protein